MRWVALGVFPLGKVLLQNLRDEQPKRLPVPVRRIIQLLLEFRRHADGEANVAFPRSAPFDNRHFLPLPWFMCCACALFVVLCGYRFIDIVYIVFIRMSTVFSYKYDNWQFAQKSTLQFVQSARERVAQMQERYWNAYQQAVADCFYFQIYSTKSTRKRSCILCFLSLVSCASVAAWGFWDTLPWLWSILVAISQVLNVLNRFFFYAKQEKIAPDILSAFREIEIEMEHDLYNVLNGMDDSLINDKLYEINKKRLAIENTKDSSVVFPQNKRYMRTASLQMAAHVRQKFSILEGDANDEQKAGQVS